MTRLRLTFIAFALSILPIGATAKTTVYVSVSGENRIACYEFDAETGYLTPFDSVELPGAPGSLAISPDKRFMYAAIRSEKSFGTLSVDPVSGELKLLNTTPAGGSAAYVTTDRTGHWLLAAYYGEGKVTVNRIAEDRTVTEPAAQEIETGKKAHSIQLDATNRFAFTPHTGETNKVQQFKFDAQTGKLTPNEPDALRPPEGEGPRHFVFHPHESWVYFVNEQGGSVTACKMDKGTGTLTPFQTHSTLPEEFTGKNTCADVHITPHARYLYASNRGHDSIAGFKIDNHTGQLTSLGQTPTEPTPRSFAILPSGKHLLSAGQGSGKMALYEINEDTGALNLTRTYEVGKSPAWVLALDLNKLVAD